VVTEKKCFYICFGVLVILKEVKNVSTTLCLVQEVMEDFSSSHVDRSEPG
jgi:hypothetical protein